MNLTLKKSKKKEIQTTLDKYTSKQIALDISAYKILSKIKKQLIIKHERYLTFSDAVRELEERSKK